MDVYIDPIAPVAARSTSSAPATSAGTWRASPPTPASASTSSTTARSSPTRERFPGADDDRRRRHRRRGCTAPSSRRRAYVVVVTRGHTHDLDALRALAARDLRYLGLIGSRAKVARIYDALAGRRHAGRVPRRASTRRSASTSARSRPPEIAVSILAELIAVKPRQVDASPRCR